MTWTMKAPTYLDLYVHTMYTGTLNTSISHTVAFSLQRLLILSRARLNMCPHTLSHTHALLQILYTLMCLIFNRHHVILSLSLSRSLSFRPEERPGERLGRCLLLA